MAEGPVAILSEHPGGDSGSTDSWRGSCAYRPSLVISGISHPPDANRIESYVKCPDTSDKQGTLAAPDDVRHIIGNLDEAKLLDIMALHPTTRDAEQAFMWLAGDTDIFGAGQPLKGAVADIVAILTSDEEEEQSRS